MPSPLEALSGPSGPLHQEPPDKQEFAGVVKSGETRLADAGLDGLSLEGRFDLAYNAAHALCLAALRRSGFRSSKRYIVFQALPHTLGLGPEVWRVLDRAHNVKTGRGDGSGESMWERGRVGHDGISVRANVSSKVHAALVEGRVAGPAPTRRPGP